MLEVRCCKNNNYFSNKKLLPELFLCGQVLSEAVFRR
jgi:hypothetical protein